MEWKVLTPGWHLMLLFPAYLQPYILLKKEMPESNLQLLGGVKASC
jgi:hypothetical protein